MVWVQQQQKLFIWNSEYMVHNHKTSNRCKCAYSPYRYHTYQNSLPFITNFRSRSDNKNSSNLNLVQQFCCYLSHIMQHKLIWYGRQQQLHCGTLLVMIFYLHLSLIHFSLMLVLFDTTIMMSVAVVQYTEVTAPALGAGKWSNG